MAKTHVVMIIDKSGSMQSVHGATVEGFNAYIGKLKEDLTNDYRVTLTLFDTEISRQYTDRPLHAVHNLDADSYQPNGGTSLYDAACRTLKDVNSEGADKTLVVIITDGEENSSKEYTETQFRDYVKLLTNTGRFSFVYLGANQDSWSNAQKWGIPQMNVSNFNATGAGVARAFGTAASGTQAFAMNASTTTDSFFSESDQNNLKNTL